MRALASCFILLFLFVGVFAAGAEDAADARKVKCPICGMFVAPYANWNARISFKDASEAIFDGAKDMFKYYRELKKYNPTRTKADVTAISVKDYYSKEFIDAWQAFFVIWSDVYGPMGNEPIPFQREADAKKFLKEHKGRKILKFKDITAQVIIALDNP
jgi:copper chaperone NosL